MPLIGKDYLKEAIWDALDATPGDLAWSRRTGGAAMEVLWAIAERAERFVLEANFRPHSAYELQRLERLGGRSVEVYCECPPEIAVSRYAARAASPGHHDAHVGRTLSLADVHEFDRPLSRGSVVRVDTTATVDLADVVTRVKAALAT
jgi:hypothetical protein